MSRNAAWWDEWWENRLTRRVMVTPGMPGPCSGFWPGLSTVMNNDNMLVCLMNEYGLRTVLCAGNGALQEPRYLARAGFDVTALDISPVVTRFAEAYRDDKEPYGMCHPRLHRPGGRARFVAGDLLDASICRGPFDVVIERKTVQTVAERDRPAVLSALSERLARVGIFVSMCFDDPFPDELGWSQHPSGMFHASEAWFRDQGWTIWENEPNLPDPTLAGRVAWLIRAGSGKCRR